MSIIQSLNSRGLINRCTSDKMFTTFNVFNSTKESQIYINKHFALFPAVCIPGVRDFCNLDLHHGKRDRQPSSGTAVSVNYISLLKHLFIVY